ncbi:FAD-binding oxidoreductase [uncultured Agrococcus sp.]|uniref:FAD-binding oxidoreductase n=1 Tax=uncultured Agrococcus sp. TaxID=382258 RepID=UPI0025E0E3FE|nr:FAD-binding oxidoreductase [uncultured Agrococcus sp.]
MASDERVPNLQLLEDRTGMSGRFHTPGTAQYEKSAKLVFDGSDRLPAVTVRPRSAEEVSRLVQAARELDWRIAVRGGGHGFARHALAAGSLVLDMRELDTVSIDPARRIGAAGGGVLAGEYTRAAWQHGLATGFGDSPDVGVAGLTLGGGIGFLSRRDGLTIDSLHSAEIVLADGRIVTASEEENATGDHRDLFWALRGGGGNFGVVTRLEFELRPTAPVTGGIMAFEPTPENLERAVSAVLEAPDELSVMMSLMPAPPMPAIPAALHGELLMIVLPCWSGSSDRAERMLAPLRRLGPVAEQIAWAPYPSLLQGPPPFPEPTLPASRSGFADTVDRQWAERAIDAVRTAPTASTIQIRPMGGAIARVPSAETAFAHRERAVMAFAGALTPDPGLLADAHAWLDTTTASLGLTGRYVNFMSVDTEDDVAGAYPGRTMERLRRIKGDYDPANTFSSNHNILPARAEPSAA